MLEPKSGKVKINDKDHDYSRPVVTNLSFVRGENYFIDTNIIENIALKSMNDLNNDEIKKIEKLITLVNMDEFLNRLELKLAKKEINYQMDKNKDLLLQGHYITNQIY